MRNDVQRQKTTSSMGSIRHVEENEYLINQQTMLAKSTVLNEMLSFKKELEKSERRCEQIAQQFEVRILF